MNRKISREQFDNIKNFINTPILVKPPIRYVADIFGYSSGTISQINRFGTFEEYKKYNTTRYKRDIENDMLRINEDRERVKKEIEDFNNEWYFKEN